MGYDLKLNHSGGQHERKPFTVPGFGARGYKVWPPPGLTFGGSSLPSCCACATCGGGPHVSNRPIREVYPKVCFIPRLPCTFVFLHFEQDWCFDVWLCYTRQALLMNILTSWRLAVDYCRILFAECQRDLFILASSCNVRCFIMRERFLVRNNLICVEAFA